MQSEAVRFAYSSRQFVRVLHIEAGSSRVGLSSGVRWGFSFTISNLQSIVLLSSSALLFLHQESHFTQCELLHVVFVSVSFYSVVFFLWHFYMWFIENYMG